MPAGMLKTRMKLRNHRRRGLNDIASPIAVVTSTKATNTIAIVFNQVVSLNGTPAYTTNLAGVTATAAVLTITTTPTGLETPDQQLNYNASLHTIKGTNGLNVASFFGFPLEIV